jgi:hypothetical protein
MLKLNLSFDVSLLGTIINVLGSTQPRHPNTKILEVSFLVPNPIKLKTSNATQKFPKN